LTVASLMKSRADVSVGFQTRDAAQHYGIPC
jgi:hypothetical protein